MHVSLVQLKNGLFNLRKIVRRKLGRLLQATPTLVSTGGVLEHARTFLEKGEIAPALEYYCLAMEQDYGNLEAYIGASICQIELGNRNGALEILQKADTTFGDHDAILGLITRYKLHEKAYGDVEIYWSRWRKSYSQHPTLDFYQATGEILVSLLKSNSNSSVFFEKLLSDLVFQDDRSVDSKSHPVICSLLFHLHEYDRPFYLLLREAIKSFLGERKAECKKSTLCTVVMLLFVGLVSNEERRNLLRDHFYEFELYPHWSFVLIGSSWNAVWDESVQINTDSIAIIQEILRNVTTRLDVFGAEQTYKMIFLANVCCREVTTMMIEHAQKLLDKDKGAGGEDLAFIVQKYKAPIKDQKRGRSQRLNIAVCVSGQLRGWKQAFRSWHQIGLADHDVTYIVHTWKDTGGGSPIPPKDERAFPIRFQKEFRKVWNQLGHDEMLFKYPMFFSLWPQNGTEVDVNDLRRTYGAEYVYVEDDSIEPFRNMSNSEKMYYKIWACQEAADKVGIDFDLIIRIRPDLEFIEKKQIDWNSIYLDCTRRNVLFCESYSTYFFPNIGFCMPDNFSIASPDVMRGYASAYAMTKRYPRGDNFKLTKFPQDFIAHRNVAYSTLYNGAVVDAVALPCRFSPTFKPSNKIMLEAIYQDALDRNDPFDEILIGSLMENLRD